MLERYPKPFLAIYVCDALNMPFNVVFAVEFVILHLVYGPRRYHVSPYTCYPVCWVGLPQPLLSGKSWVRRSGHFARTMVQRRSAMHVDASYSNGKSGGYW